MICEFIIGSPPLSPARSLHAPFGVTNSARHKPGKRALCAVIQAFASRAMTTERPALRISGSASRAVSVLGMRSIE